MPEVTTDPRVELARLSKELERAKAELATAKKRSQSVVRCKVSAKGALSVYGLGRFPVTLYASQWERLIGEIPQIKAFLKEAAGDLARKE